MARFGRQAYPGRGEVTTHERLGCQNHGCPPVATVAVGATRVVSTPAGRHMREGLQPRKGRRAAVAARTWWSADPVRPRGRTPAGGGRRARGPAAPPGGGGAA